jgi:hypothetical protein
MDPVIEVLEYCRKNMCTPDGRRNCLLCARRPVPGGQAAVGVFIADEQYQERLGAPKNKTRLFIYLLCEDCHSHPHRNKMVQDKIFAVASVQ